MLGRIFCLGEREYGYKGKDIDGHIQKDPAVVTRYFKEREELETEKVIKKIKSADINKQI